MKHLRKFPDAETREEVLSAAVYDILSYTEGFGINIKTEGSGHAYPTPFYVENITQETETLTIAGYDWTGQSNYLEIPVEYSTDGTNWNSFGITGETPLARTLQPGEKIYLRATTNTWNEYLEGTEEHDEIVHNCTIFGVSKVGGNAMSLLYGSNFTGSETVFPSGSTQTFAGLFNGIDDEEYNRNLISASELVLPATTLTYACYRGMFYGCTLLTAAPELPATTLVSACYSNMFAYCTSLTTSPELPAIVLASECYTQLFEGCSSLTSVPAILPATVLAESCYLNMFNGCSLLTAAPELPATTLVSGCYAAMFYSCTNLNYIKCLATDISAIDCISNWTYDISATGTFIKDPNMVDWTTDTSGIPSGWTVQDAA